MHVDVRSISVGHIHADSGDPQKVARMHAWLLEHPDADLGGLARHLHRHPVIEQVPQAPLPTRAVRRTSPRPTAPRPGRRHEPV